MRLPSFTPARQRFLLPACAAVALLLSSATAATTAHAAVIYFGDEIGNVGSFDTTTSSTSIIGSLSGSGFTPGQVIGLAYSSSLDAILIFDRNVNNVYAMNATTGATSLVFNAGFSFQGGAVANNLIYGIDENSQTVQAFSLTGVNQNLASGSLAVHSHGLGVDGSTGQLYSAANSGGIVYRVNANGTAGANVITPGTSTGVEDLEFFQGDFLAATYSNTLTLINGATGATSTFLTGTQTSAAGITANVTGVALRTAAATPSAAPEPGSLVLLLPVAGMAGMAGMVLRTRRRN